MRLRLPDLDLPEIDTALVLKLLKKVGLSPVDVMKFLVRTNLSILKFNRATPQERAKMLKTALRTALPYPHSLAAGEILVRLKEAFRPIRDAIANGVKK